MAAVRVSVLELVRKFGVAGNESEVQQVVKERALLQALNSPLGDDSPEELYTAAAMWRERLWCWRIFSQSVVFCIGDLVYARAASCEIARARAADAGGRCEVCETTWVDAFAEGHGLRPLQAPDLRLPPPHVSVASLHSALRAFMRFWKPAAVLPDCTRVHMRWRAAVAHIRWIRHALAHHISGPVPGAASSTSAGDEAAKVLADSISMTTWATRLLTCVPRLLNDEGRRPLVRERGDAPGLRAESSRIARALMEVFMRVEQSNTRAELNSFLRDRICAPGDVERFAILSRHRGLSHFSATDVEHVVLATEQRSRSEWLRALETAPRETLLTPTFAGTYVFALCAVWLFALKVAHCSELNFVRDVVFEDLTLNERPTTGALVLWGDAVALCERERVAICDDILIALALWMRLVRANAGRFRPLYAAPEYDLSRLFQVI